MSAAISAKGATLKVGATAVAEVKAVNGLNLKLDTVDVTSHASTGGWKEFITTLRDAGDVTLDINYVPTDVTQKNAAGGLLYLLTQGAVQAFSIVWPNVAATTWSFNGFVTAFQPKAPHDNTLTATVTIKATGAPTIA
jgi:predicted secreted protein